MKPNCNRDHGLQGHVWRHSRPGRTDLWNRDSSCGRPNLLVQAPRFCYGVLKWKPFWNKSMVNYPRGRPTAGSDHYIHTYRLFDCPSVRPHFSKLSKVIIAGWNASWPSESLTTPMLLIKITFLTWNIPNSNSLVKWSRHQQVFAWMELSAHDIVIVAGQDGNAASTLPVPNSDGLIIRAGQHPRILMMKHGGPDVIQMAQEVKEASLLLVIPHLKPNTI